MSAVLSGITTAARALGERGAPQLEGLGEDEAARRAVALCAEAGLLRWFVPAAWGGADTDGLVAPTEVSTRAACAVRDELAWHAGMLDVMLVMQGLGSYAVALAGPDEMRERVLPGVAKGELIAAFGLTEPGAGSDLGAIATRAERVGDRWRLTGHKTFISNAGLADFYTVLARTSGEPGDGGRESLTMFLVPGAAAGLRVERFEVMAPHPIGDVFLEDVEVEDGARIGAAGCGLEVALSVLGRFRTSVAAAANGFARRALAESLAHCRARQQFGRPLASFQGLRFDLAEMDARLRGAQLLVDEAASCVDLGTDATKAVARAKLVATEGASWICDRAVQHLGGLGVKRGQIVERLYRDVRALRIYEGTSEVQKLILAKELLRG